MEKSINPETLAESPINKTLQEASLASGLFGLSENRSGSVLVSVEKNGGVVGVNEHGIGVDNVAVGSGILEEGGKGEGVEIKSLVVSVDSVAAGEENCSNVGGDEEGSLADNGFGRKTQTQTFVVDPLLDEGCLLVDYENAEMRVKGAMPVQEMGMLGNVSEEFGVEKIMGDEVEMQSKDTDSAEKVEVRGDGISLVVEVCCPPTGVIQGNLDEANKESLVMLDTKNDGSIEEAKASAGRCKEEGAVDNFESSYSLGDLVWVKTKNLSWWPGQICDPDSLDVSKHTDNSQERDCIFVRSFGNGTSAWCSPSQLKHFSENFEQMSSRSNSKSFRGALDKAVGELSRHLKLKMTCSCNSKESQSNLCSELAGDAQVKKEVSVPQHNISKHSVTLFEPAAFLAYHKHLAQVVSMPGMLEFAVIQSRLWAYYCSVGHSQLHPHQLQDLDVQIGDQNRPAEEDLLCPYKKEQEDIAKLSGEDKDMDGVPGDYRTSVAEEGTLSEKQALDASKRKRLKDGVGIGSDEADGLEPRKLVSPSKEGTDLSRSPTTTEGKVSSEGHVDGRTDGSAEKSFELRERKKSKYLSPPYIDLKFGRKGLPISGESDTEDSKISKGSDRGMAMNELAGHPAIVKCSGKKLQKKSLKKPIDVSKKLEGLNASSADLLSELHLAALDCLYPKGNRLFDLVEIFFSMFRRSVYRDESNCEMYSKNIVGQKEVLEPLEAAPNGIIPSVVENVDKSTSSQFSPANVTPLLKMRKNKRKVDAGSQVIDSQRMGSPAPDIKPQQKKRKKKEVTTPVLVQAKAMASIPDLNGNSVLPSLNLENSQVMNRAVSEGKPEPKKRKKKMKEGIGSELLKTNITDGCPNMNGNNVEPISLVVDLQMDPQLNKNEGNETATSVGVNINFGSGLLDGRSNGSQEKILTSPEGKPVGKKRKRKEKAMPDSQKSTSMQTSLGMNINFGAGLQDGSGNNLSQEKILPSPEGKPEDKKRKKKEKAMPDSQKSTSMQTSVCMNINFGDGFLDGNGNNMSQEKILPSPEGKPEGKKRKKKEKAMSGSQKSTSILDFQKSTSILDFQNSTSVLDFQKSTSMLDCQKSTSSGIPDLNGIGIEPIVMGKDLQGVNCVLPKVKLERKKRQKREARSNASSIIDSNKYRKVKTNAKAKALRTTLLLTFASGTMPLKEVLFATFFRFESLRESETKVFKDSSTAHVVFARSSDAVDALQYLETSNPFGPALISYRLQHLPTATSGLGPDKNLSMPPVQPVSSPSNPPQGTSPPAGEAAATPPISIIRQNLEMMTSMLEKSGDNLTPKMKAKLEADITGLMKKVSTMAGSSSS